MAGTKIGSIKSVKKIYAFYGQDHFAKIGALGGSRSTRGGFWYKKHVLSDTESIRRAGMLGGRISRRGKHKLTERERLRIRHEYEKAYEEQLAVHNKAMARRADKGAITVFDRKRGLVLSEMA